MKKLILILTSLLTITLFTTSCSSNKGGDQHQTVDENGPEYTSAYICPMHCPGSGSSEPGTCPTCGMEYQKNENASEDSGHEEHMDGGHMEEHHHDSTDEHMHDM